MNVHDRCKKFAPTRCHIDWVINEVYHKNSFWYKDFAQQYFFIKSVSIASLIQNPWSLGPRDRTKFAVSIFRKTFVFLWTA